MIIHSFEGWSMDEELRIYHGCGGKADAIDLSRSVLCLSIDEIIEENGWFHCSKCEAFMNTTIYKHFNSVYALLVPKPSKSKML